MTTLETSGTQVQGAGQTSWTVPLALPDHAAAYWRSRASDAYVAGAWTDLQSFNVNTSNNAPTDPIAFAPLSGDLLSSLTPDLTWVTSSDPEGTTVTYDVRVWDETLTTLITEATGITDDTLDAYGSWTVDTALTEDTTYIWTVRAVDADGLNSAWTFPESFTISTGNAAPSDVAWLSPLDADELSEVSPTLIWSASSDPEGTAVFYRVEADIDAGFGAATGWDLSSNSVDLANAGAALTENVDNYLRVRAIDADGISSNWSVISVFVRGENDAPSIPTLLSPDDAAALTDTTPALSATESTDAEGDAITYVFKVAQNADLSGLNLSSPELSASAGSVNWDVSSDLSPGTWYWSVQATDALGAESGWSEIRSFVLPDVADTGDTAGDTAIDTNVPDDSGDITDDSAPTGNDQDTGKDDEGCGCSANGQSSLPLGMVAVAGILMASRRRRA
jgi:MYXO-CTERM domain-containing protein